MQQGPGGTPSKPKMYSIKTTAPIEQRVQRDIAEDAKCSRGLISALVTGRIKDVNEHTARAIARACGTPFKDMFADTGRLAHDRT